MSPAVRWRFSAYAHFAQVIIPRCSRADSIA
jgi:hypothetical protein